ncbi:MAG: TIM barrel protein [Actinobacteria bacterium]|nr:TIM barrel protein [Actinomycetota bacterium]
MSSIKIGVAGWGFRQMSLREYFDTASRLDLPLLELNCRADVPGHIWVDFDQQDVTEVLDCAADEGIEIVALSADNDFTQTDPAALNSQVAQLRRIIELADQLGAKYVRVVVGRDVQCAPAVLETAVRKLQEAAQFADSFPVRLAVENGFGPLVSVDHCLAVMQQLQSDSVGLLYNPANFARNGDDPVKALELLGEHICYSHLTDWDGKEFCAIGRGTIDWKSVVGLLSDCRAEIALIEYPYPQDIELGTAAGQKKLTSLLRKIDG